jgi:hypothetical protein
MAKRRHKRGRSWRMMLFLIWIPTVVGAIGLGAAADQWLPGAISGAAIGFVIGIALAAFPNLDEGGPDDTSPFPD